MDTAEDSILHQPTVPSCRCHSYIQAVDVRWQCGYLLRRTLPRRTLQKIVFCTSLPSPPVAATRTYKHCLNHDISAGLFPHLFPRCAADGVVKLLLMLLLLALLINNLMPLLLPQVMRATGLHPNSYLYMTYTIVYI